MTKIILSTGNCMSAGPSVIRRHGVNRSNLEFIQGLRDNFHAAQIDYAIASADSPIKTNGNYANHTNGASSLPTPPSPQKLAAIEAWTERSGNVLFVPRIEWRGAGLRDESSQYEITVKLFVSAGAPAEEREQYIREALDLVRKELGVEYIDLLVISFPGISFEGSCEWEADKINAHQGNLEEELATWRILESLHQQGLAKRLGVAEFGSEKLGAFIKRATVPPVVDQINLKDCCSVPPPLGELAKAHGVELNVHTDCTDILPPGTLRELLGSHGAGVLSDGDSNGGGLKGDIQPQWVARYMAFVKNRGVIENKGYFAGAQLHNA